MRRERNILVVLAMTLFLCGCPSSDVSKHPSGGQAHQSIDLLLPDALRSNVWSAISSDFALDDNVDHPMIKREINYFLKHKEYLNELASNAEPYLYYIYDETRKRGMPAEIALLPMVESNYYPFGVSTTGATGIWQMMPGTASGFGININWWYDGRRDIRSSTQAALNYLSYLHNHFGNWLLAIAAYNSGEGTVEMAIRHNKKLGKPTDYWSLPLPYQTKMYVPKLIALANIFENPDQYHFDLPDLKNRPYFKAVHMHGQIDLNRVAQFSDTPLSTIRLLNPGFRRWATMPNQSYALLLPTNKVNTYLANLQHHKNNLVTWIHHNVKTGESLYAIADKYKTKATIIRKVNNLHNDTIHPQENLLIPLAYNHLNLHIIKKAPKNIAEDKIPGPKRFVHRVTRNDNLWTIAKHYHVTPDQIRYWNNLAYRAKLSINQPLTIWEQHRFKKPVFYTYKVRKGDSLIRIAKRFNTHVHTIQRINHLNGNMIRLGLTLNIPRLAHHGHKHFIAKLNNQLVTHHVHNGETLSSIAHYYQVPLKSLMAWNHISNDDALSDGQVLHVYITNE
jgi:membrane-bound lytic murein transglycosylase D